MHIEGAEWSESGELLACNEISVKLKPILFKWIKENFKVNNDELMVPIYLHKARKNLIYSLKVFKLIFY
jgi:hypothetical protein